jgi:Concanavalin A-like lectin/glucanases superfamily
MSQTPLGIQRHYRAVESASLRGRRSAPLAALVWLAVGCSASATGVPPVQQTSDAGGNTSTTNAGAGNSSAAGAANAASGAPSSGGSSAGSGSSKAGAGGMPSSGGSAGTSTTTGAGGHCNTTGPNGEAFYDGFEDGEYTTCPEWLDADPTLGGMWSVKTDGDTKVLAQSAAVSDWVIAVSGDYTLTDQTVEAKVKFTSSPGMIGIFARFQDARDFYYLYLDGSNIIVRGKVNNSSITSVKAKAPAVEGTWYTLKLSVIGSTLTGYLNDTMMVTTTDPSVLSGGVGVGTSDSATGEFDDVTVSAP